MTAQLYNGDCLQIMSRLPSGSVDAIICDLPYGTTACSWDAVIPFDQLWREYRRIAKPNAAIVLTASQPFTSALLMSNVTQFRHAWVWNKAKAANFPQVKRHPLKVHEDVLVFGTSKTLYSPQMREGEVRKKGGYSTANRDVAVSAGAPAVVNGLYYPKSILDISIAGNQDAGLHPTQKPVALMEYLIRTYTNPGDVVLDNCMGSGTTGVAAMNTGRRFIGIERDPEYFAICQRRIQAPAPKVIDIAEWQRRNALLASQFAALQDRINRRLAA
jgi:site-specific DNA-methyltransferase (adenine-specific)